MPDIASPANGKAVSSAYMQTMWREQVVRTCTSLTRPAVLKGAVGYETDTDTLIVCDANPNSDDGWSTWLCPAFGAGTTYTPTLTQSGAVTKTVTQAMYIRIGRRIIGNVLLTCTGAGTASNLVLVGLPIAAAGTTNLIIGSGWLYDASAALQYAGALVWVSSTTAMIVPNNVSTFGLGVVSFTAALANTDQVGFFFSYETTSD